MPRKLGLRFNHTRTERKLSFTSAAIHESRDHFAASFTSTVGAEPSSFGLTVAALINTRSARRKPIQCRKHGST